MTLHKLTAGSGYDYLTRQVAAWDATSKGGAGLASYYTEKGEIPGVWKGAGMAGIDGLEVGDQVTPLHMLALFGHGQHPLAHQRMKELDGAIGRPGVRTPTERDYAAATRLGTPYKVYDNDVTPFQREVARRFSAFNETDGLPKDWPIPASERARIRTEVAREFFLAEHGREPEDAREVAAAIAKFSRPKTTAISGYDLTFSPVKSFSVMWALADQATAAKLEEAHNAAVDDALKFLEKHALFTREGTNGVRQVNVRGLVATAFTHRDSRAGDPDLHTHVAIANKVQTLAGKWLAIDGRTLYKMTVAVSEHYNMRLEAHAQAKVGVRFAERPNDDARKRPVREIIGIDAGLEQRFSKRRANIEQRRGVLVAEFQRTHGRPPTPIETLELAQQATLETREAKHEPRTMAEMRAAWEHEATAHMGSIERVKQMLHQATHPAAAPAPRVNSKWFAKTADQILATMENGRATWQPNHVIAEAKRHVKAAELPIRKQDHAIELLVDAVLSERSISLARPSDGIREPAVLRRLDGSSQYTVAHTALHTSANVMAAEARLVAAAGATGGRAVADEDVELALLESAANGVTLNPGQTTLVREMAASGARLQLAIAPAGSGKTTAMKVLARAWSEHGGTVIGLAPSAAAAAELGAQFEQTDGSVTDTLAKLVWHLDRGEVPPWAEQIDARTLVVIDEAGMADTVSLDKAVQFVLAQGGSVRLIGDDQQLAAIGAGGVLRDIRATHGALQLSELMRFADPAEGAASLALREGRTEALGYYLDQHRVHVGDLATMTDEVFAAWQSDRAEGRDAIMLAPNRDLVSELNQRARAARIASLATEPAAASSTDVATGPAAAAGGTVRLSDGNEASVGDLIITRSNARKLRMTASDWVKNGDRWTILDVHDSGDLTVKHTKTGHQVQLPAAYVAESTDLGYACTVHTAQGVTADVMHGLANGEEARQQFYTMMTRGRLGNHVYLGVVGDGDPHSVIRPELIHPRTPTDVLEQILARDGALKSATTLQREASDPAVLLGEATQQYVDSLYVAAEHVLGSEAVAGLDDAADRVVSGLSEQAAWPALRAHLLLIGASGDDPIQALTAAAESRELSSAGDQAAVLDWRLDASGLRNAGPGPLPWLHAAPARIREHPEWGAYLQQRADRVASLAAQVRKRAEASEITPVWAANGTRLDAKTIANIEVWRAAMQVDPEDRRPTGPAQQQKAAGVWQRRLNRAVAGDRTPAIREWKHLIAGLNKSIAGDDFTPLLAERLASMSRSGINARGLLAHAAAMAPLPDDHAAAALWWRISRHVSPAVAARLDEHDQVTTATWTRQLATLLGAERADALQHSTWWPALVSVVDHGLQRGWNLPDLIGVDPTNPAPAAADVDECQAMVWRASIALSDIPTDTPDTIWDLSDNEAPEDLYDDYDPNLDDLDQMWTHVPEEDWTALDPGIDPDLNAPYEEPTTLAAALEPAAFEDEFGPELDSDFAHDAADGAEAEMDFEAQRTLTLAGMSRNLRVIPEELFDTEADISRQMRRAMEWDDFPLTRERMLEINQLAQRYFEQQFTAPDAWGRPYLADRFGLDVAGNTAFRPGQAPAGWTNLVTYLRRHGVRDEEMIATGLARTSSKGNTIDIFRDRVMFPIVHPGAHGPEILGFVGRRRPELTDQDANAGRKYLNTAATPLFSKGGQLFIAGQEHFANGATPVIVEGPMDAIAITLATSGVHVGVAPLGTSLTEEQVAQLARQFQRHGRDPIVATDADLAGQVAAERDFWMLTGMSLDPAYAQMPNGSDPADLLATRGPDAIADVLNRARPLGQVVLTERLDNLSPDQARAEAVRVLSARPGYAWDTGVDQIVSRLQVSELQVRRDLASAVTAWDADPRRAASDAAADASEVRKRLESAALQAPGERWAPLAASLDARLTGQKDWPILADLMQEISAAGHDVATTARELVDEKPLGENPARELRYRLVGRAGVAISTGEKPTSGGRPSTAAKRMQPTTVDRPTGPRR